MSLGGYKFAGRYCQKGSLTDQQWAKRMQETKVAAFMAANALANAGWEYDMDGSPDGNIHCLDTVGNNYCTCFKNTASGHYFCILTLTMFRYQTETAGYVVTTRLCKISASNGHYSGRYSTHFARYSTSSRFNYDAAVSQWYTGQTLLLPLCNPGPSSASWSGTDTNVATRTYLNVASTYFGFAIKGTSIVTISGGTGSYDRFPVCVISGDAYSSVFSGDESYGNNKGVLFVNFQSLGTTTSNLEWDGAYIYTQIALVMSPNSTSNTNTDSLARIFAPPVACYSGNVQDYPFESVYVTCYKQNPTSMIYGRGIVKIDLISANQQNTASYPNRLKPVANGNYLAVRSNADSSNSGQLTISSGSSGAEGISSNTIPQTFYVGWDPSNPDITQASAWTLYTGE